jgi:hypothetical protein
MAEKIIPPRRPESNGAVAAWQARWAGTSQAEQATGIYDDLPAVLWAGSPIPECPGIGGPVREGPAS